MKALAVVHARSIANGLNLFEELNRVGLIATEPRIREIQESTLRNMLDALETGGETELTMKFARGNSNPATATDMFRAVTDWIKHYMSTRLR